jgi:peptidoglycan biosynthesis protein MviN/MurJ (putative lipid II flippase)
LVTVATVIFDGGVAPWLLARWASQRIQAGLDVTWTSVYRPLAWAAGLAASVAFVLAAGAPIVVGVVLNHGSFSASDAAVVTSLLRWYAVGYWLNMNALCVERLLLARAQNRLFAGLAAIRAGTRLGTVVVALSALGIFALPLGYLVSEGVYLTLLLVFGTRRVEAVVA